MAALTHSESKSWGLEKFNPKNSKWLQGNISDTERKVKAMIKILDEDADSFARRAEMYYKRRPELMNLVKEFYGAYRSLAERYDVAAGALRQAQLSISLSDDPPSEPQTPEIAPPGRSLFAPDDSISPNVKRIDFGSSISPTVKRNDLEKKVLRLSEETERLKDRVLGETERANKAEQEILTLKGSLLELSFEKDEAWEKCQAYGERVSQLESELLKSQIDLKRLSENERLNDEQKLELELLEKKVVLQEMKIEEFNEKLGEIERSKVESVREIERLSEQSVLSEMTVRKLQSKIGVLEGTMERMKLEIIALKKENGILSEKLHETEECKINHINEIGDLKNTISNLESDKEMVLRGFNNLKLEMAIKADMLKSAEKMNYKQETELEMLQKKVKSQEAFNQGLIREIGYLNEQKISSEEKISNLSKDLNFLRETKEKLEKEIEVHLREKETLQKNLSIQIQDTFDFVNKLQVLTNQTEQAIKANTVLKEAFTKYEVERGILSEKNEVLERELDNLNAELEILRERINELEISERSLKNENAVHISEKADFELYFGQISEKNSSLKKSLSNLKSEFDDLMKKLRDSEENNSDLIAEKNDLFSHVEKFEEKITNLEEKNSALSTERDLMQNDLMDLQELLSYKNQEHEAQISIHVSEKLDLSSQIENLFKNVREFNSEIDKLGEKLKESEAEKSTLFSEKRDILLQVESMRAVIKNLEENEKDLIKEKYLKQNRMKELEGFLSSKNEEHELNSISFQKEISNLNFEIENLRGKLKEFEANKSALISEKADLESQVEDLEEKNSALIKEKDLTQNRVKELEEILSSKTEELESNSTLFQDQISNLNFEIDNLRGKLKESEHSCKSLIVQKWNLLSEKDDLLSQVERITNAMKNLEEKHSELEEKTWELSHEKDLMQNQLIIHLNNLNHTINDITTKNNAEIKNLREKLTESEIEISGHISEKNSLKTKIEMLSCIIDEMKSRNDELNNSLSDLNSQLENLREKLKVSEENKSALINEKNNLFSKVESMEIIIKNFEEKHTELEEKHFSLSKERDFNQNELNKLEKLLTSKSEEHKSAIQSQISTHNSQRETLQNTINEISRKNSELESLVSNLNLKFKDLHEQRSILISEKDDLSSQLHSIQTIMKKLETKQEDLEENHSIISKEKDLMHIQLNEYSRKNSELVSNFNSQIDSLNSKLKESEKYCESLHEERSFFISEKDDLSSQLHSMKKIMKSLESKHEDLEENHLIITKERDLMQIHLNELKNYLHVKNQEHLNKIDEISGKNYELESLASNLNSKIDDLNSERTLLIAEKDDLSSQVYSIKAIMKNLESKHEDLEEDYSIISKERGLIQIQLNELNNYSHAKNQEYLNKIDEISGKNFELENFISNLNSQIDDLNSKRSLLTAEKDDLSSQLYGMKTLMKSLESKHEDLEENHSIISKERDLMQIQLNELNDFLHAKNQEYLSTVKSHELHVTNLQNEILSHVSKIQTLENSIHEISEKNSKLENYLSNICLEKDTLFSQVKNLEQKHLELETKHSNVLEERELMQNQINNMHLNVETEQLKNSSVSNHLFILERSLSDMVDQHLQASLLTEQVISQLEKEERENELLKIQNEDLKIQNEDLIKLKEKNEDWNACLDIEILVLNTVLRNLGLDLDELKLVNGDLERGLEISKNEFMNKIEGLNANLAFLKDEMVKNEEIRNELEMENSGLIKELLICENLNLFFENLCNERGALLEYLNDEVAFLNSDKFELNKKVDLLEGENKTLKEELGGLVILQLDLNHMKNLNEALNLEIEGVQVEKKGLEKNIEKCEKYISYLINEIISLEINCTVFEENLFELMVENEGLEISALAQRETIMEGIFVKDTFIEGLNAKLVEMESENAKLKGGLDAYSPLVELLRDCVASLELHTHSLSKRLHSSQFKQEKLICDSPLSEIPSGALELQNLICKIEYLEESLINTSNQLKNNLESNNKTPLDQPESSSKSKYNYSPIISMKDIELDKISSSFLYNNEIKEIEDPMLHLWEEKPRKSSSVNGEHDIQAIQEIRTGPHSSEKEQSEDMKKVLEILDLDSQRLEALKSGVEELKRKLEGKLVSNNDDEYNDIKLQVYETEKVLNKQMEINSKVIKNAECYYNNNSGNLDEEQRLVRKRKIQEVTERGTEKIGRLELEFEKVKYVMMRLEETCHDKRRGGRSEEKRVRVLLRDYIYGRRKKMPLCGCIRAERH